MLLIILLCFCTIINCILLFRYLKKTRRLELQNSNLRQLLDEAHQTIDEQSVYMQLRMDDFSSRIKSGRLLFDSIMQGGTTSSWSKDHYKMFAEYYRQTHPRAISHISNGRDKELTPHNLFYLILKEEGKTDKEVARIMGISKEAIRTLRFRTKKH